MKFKCEFGIASGKQMLMVSAYCIWQEWVALKMKIQMVDVEDQTSCWSEVICPQWKRQNPGLSKLDAAYLLRVLIQPYHLFNTLIRLKRFA